MNKNITEGQKLIEKYLKLQGHPSCSSCFVKEDPENGIYIKKFMFASYCDECINRNSGQSVIANENKKTKPKAKKNKTNIEKEPISIYNEISKKLIGQDELSRAITYSIYRQEKNKIKENCPPDTLFIIGPSGTGKTESIRILEKEYNKPVITVNCTSLTDEGYVGNSLGDVLSEQLSLKGLDNFDNTVIYFDEFDKLCNDKSVGGKGVQYQLLRIIEGEKELLYKRTNKADVYDSMEVSFYNTLFIFSGAFSHITDNIINPNKKSIGFLPEDKEQKVFISSDKLVKNGMQRELINRIGNIVFLQPLKKDDMIKIFTSPDIGFMDFVKDDCSLAGIEFIMPDDETLNVLAEKTIQERSFVRGARKILKSEMKNLIFDIQNQNIKKMTFVIENNEVKLCLMQ